VAKTVFVVAAVRRLVPMRAVAMVVFIGVIEGVPVIEHRCAQVSVMHGEKLPPGDKSILPRPPLARLTEKEGGLGFGWRARARVGFTSQP
jgi:hypothetical protein